MVIDDFGYILTAEHVVHGAKKVIVVSQDGEEYAATVLGRNGAIDLAVLEIEQGKLPAIAFGKSKDLIVGDELVAIGYPLNLEGTATVTRGSLSARRSLKDNDSVEYLQTDIAINPGNSGGPVIDSDGKVVAVVISKQFWTEHLQPVEGISFAISAESAEAAIPNLKAGKVVTRKPVLAAPPKPAVELLTIYNPEFGFQLQIPAEWGKVPPEQLEQLKRFGVIDQRMSPANDNIGAVITVDKAEAIGVKSFNLDQYLSILETSLRLLGTDYQPISRRIAITEAGREVGYLDYFYYSKLARAKRVVYIKDQSMAYNVTVIAPTESFEKKQPLFDYILSSLEVWEPTSESQADATGLAAQIIVTSIPRVADIAGELEKFYGKLQPKTPFDQEEVLRLGSKLDALKERVASTQTSEQRLKQIQNVLQYTVGALSASFEWLRQKVYRGDYTTVTDSTRDLRLVSQSKEFIGLANRIADGAVQDFPITYLNVASIDHMYDPVRELQIDERGILWVVHPSAVSRFDGESWQSWDEKNGPKFQELSALAVDNASGDVWIGSLLGELYRFSDGLWEGRTYEKLRGYGIWDMAVGHDGALWLATMTGLFRHKDDEWTRFVEKDGLPWYSVNAVAVDTSGAVWFSTLGGVGYYRNGEITSFTGPEHPPDTRELAVAKDGSVWARSDKAVFRFDGSAWKKLWDSELLALYSHGLAIDAEGKVWLGTRNGIYVSVTDDWSKWEKVGYSQIGDVKTIAVGKKGEVWIGGGVGLTSYRP
jgi:streptogramin lyase